MTAGYRLKLWVLSLLTISIPQIMNASLRTSTALQQTTQKFTRRCIPPGFCWREDQSSLWKWIEAHGQSGEIHHLYTPLQIQWHILPSRHRHESHPQLRKEFELLGLEVLEIKSQDPLLTLVVKSKNHGSSLTWQQRLVSCNGQTLVLTGPVNSAPPWNFPEVTCRE